MAIPAQGFTFLWAGNALAEVAEFEVDLTRPLPIGRTAIWTPQQGEIRLTMFSLQGIGDDYGRRRILKISNAAGTLFERDCILRDSVARAIANDVVRFVITFTVMETTGAPTNP
jgi:hypothetical protein